MSQTMTSIRTLTRDIVQGSLGFALVSLVAFSVWAFGGKFFKMFGGQPLMYAAIAVVFLALSGLVLGSLAGGIGRFYKAFVPAFFLYSVLWCAAWFGLGGRTGEWLGAAIGCLGFTWVAMKILGSTRHWLVAAVLLFVLHTAGYFAGDWALHDVWLSPLHLDELSRADRSQAAIIGKLCWGLFYGLGFGAGIGCVFHRARVGA